MRCAAFLAALLAAGVHAAGVSDTDLVKADANKAEWLIYGRTYDNQRFSPLTQITTETYRSCGPYGQCRWARSMAWRRHRS